MSQFEHNAFSEYSILDSFGGIAPGAKLQAMPSIIDWAMSSKYCGENLYPKQRTLLKIIFLEDENFDKYDRAVIDDWIKQGKQFGMGADFYIQPDIYDRIAICKEQGRKHFGEILFCLGRRSGKGHITKFINSYKIGELIMADNPQGYLGLSQEKTLELQIVAQSTTDARTNLYTDIITNVQNCEFLKPYIMRNPNDEGLKLISPWEIRRRAQQEMNEEKFDRSVASIWIRPKPAVGARGRGNASVVINFDEFAHLMNTESDRGTKAIYDAFMPSLRQTGYKGLVTMPSSPRSAVGVFKEHYDQAMEIEADYPVYPEKLLVAGASWAMYEDWQYDPHFKHIGPIIAYNDLPGFTEAIKKNNALAHEMRQVEKADPEMFSVEYRGRFASTANPFLNPFKVDAAFDGRQLIQQGVFDTVYYCHADPGSVDDKFCFALGHKEILKDEDGMLRQHVFIDYLKAWDARDFPYDPIKGKPTIDYLAIAQELLKIFQRFHVGKFSADQHQNIMITQYLRDAAKRGQTLNKRQEFKELSFSKKFNKNMFDCLKAAINMGLVHIPDYYVKNKDTMINLAKEELKFLTMKGDRIDHPTTGPVTSKDMADAIGCVVYGLIGDDMRQVREGMFTQITGAAPGGYGQAPSFSNGTPQGFGQRRARAGKAIY